MTPSNTRPAAHSFSAYLPVVFLLVALLPVPACGNDESAKQPAADVAAPADTDATPGTSVAADTSEAPDTGPTFDCTEGCANFKICDAAFPTTLCQQLCAAAETAAAAQKCLTSVGDCDALITCMASSAQPPRKPLRTFDDGKAGFGNRDLAGDFTVSTLRGNWNLKDNYDGHSSYIFLTVGKGIFTLKNGGDYLTGVWNSAHSNDIKQLMSWSADNTHYFFAAYRDADGTDNTAKYIDKMRKLFEPHLAKLKLLERMRWRNRLHFVTKALPWAKFPNESATGWLGGLTKKKPRLAFAIDRFQRLRPTGMLRKVGGDGKTLVQHLAWEGRYYNYEFKRAEEHPETPESKDLKIVTVYDAKTVNGETFDFDLPTDVANYDSLEVDVAQMCKDHEDTNCFEWDYNAHLRIVERPATPKDDETIEAGCQPRVNEVKLQDEVLGACQLAGKATDTTCKAHCDCEEKHGVGSTCKGYKPARTAVAAVVADTQACECISPRQEKVSRKRTCTHLQGKVVEAAGYCQIDGKNTFCKACKADADCGGAKGSCKGAKVAQTAKTGFGKCGCQSHYIQRWITSYHREGRWIADSSRARYYLGKGGKVRFNFKGSYPYVTTLKLRFVNKKVLPPIGLQHLFAGGGYGESYNDKYKPITVTIPKDAKKVELSAEATGHGFGSATNCAEFCNHTHHFTVKSAKGEKTWVEEHKFVGNQYGCAAQVDDGAVPNQFGTWYLGRGGWCPGMDVRVQTWDITDHVEPGEVVTFSYKSLFGGKPVGMGGNIKLDSWLVFR